MEPFSFGSALFFLLNFLVQKLRCKDFPGSSVVRTSPSSAGDAVGSLGRKVIAQALPPKNKKQKTKKPRNNSVTNS